MPPHAAFWPPPTPPVPPAPPGPPGPPAPAAPPGPADGWRAAAVALLNLSGLGLGYALIRQWAALAACLTATALLLLIALPADPDGLSGLVLTAYLVSLGLAALHGAVRGLRTPLAWPPKPPLAVLLGLVLLAAPLSGAVAYDGARDEATQQMLLDRLEEADAMVRAAKSQPFDDVEPQYRKALTAYGDLRDDHPDSRAADRVPDRLDTYYKTVGAPYAEEDYCGAIAPMKYLREVPDSIGEKTLGSLATWPDDRLATSLYECGAEGIGQDEKVTAEGGDLHELLTLFPGSSQAAKVGPAISSEVDKTADQLKDGEPCTAVDDLRTLDAQASALPAPEADGGDDTLAQASREAKRKVESGTYTCGMDQYKDGDFAAARKTLEDFTATYKENKNTPRAKKIVIAAEIAEEDPDAGKRVPTTDSGGSIPMVVSNDSPYEMEVLYTGAKTGRFTLDACGDCTPYSSESEARSTACKDTSQNYARKTINLPTGTTYFLQHSKNSSSSNPRVEKTSIQTNYTYTLCGFVVQRGLGDFDLPELDPSVMLKPTR
ncbi:hypothetical protein LHJ74_04810 [Streptomyces sp. N2-109]|uniref:Uncharacterized protein n=1 Tax=Streptomyces gossypii TaxID=2883101 RepID=A0ABT2JN05_9ACTN|nr:hypothetical protein [Streptomyces gossypii]MCT2589259.1 hypothetical protein [Streptomyces gossypii]